MAGVRTGLLLGAGLMAWLLGPGPLSPYRRALLDRSPPQLVLVLGGDVDRERMGARLARQLDLPLLVSGGSNPEYAEWMLSEERFNPDRVTLITGPVTPSPTSRLWWMSYRRMAYAMCCW